LVFKKSYQPLTKELHFVGNINTDKSLLPLVWFGPILDKKKVDIAKNKFRNEIKVRYCASFMQKLASKSDPAKWLSKVVTNFSELLNEFPTPFFDSPIFQKSSRYGTARIAIDYANIIQFYAESRSTVITKVRFRIFLTHSFKREVELAILVCTAEDDDVHAFNERTIGSLPLLCGHDDICIITAYDAYWSLYSTSSSRIIHDYVNSEFGLLISNVTLYKPRNWDNLSFAFYSPIKTPLIIPKSDFNITEVAKSHIFIGDKTLEDKCSYKNALKVLGTEEDDE